MGVGWSIQIANEGAALTNYGTPVDMRFIQRLNGLGDFTVVLPGIGSLAEPAEGQVIRIVWDLGGGNEAVRFSGIIYDVRKDEGSKSRVLRGLDLFGKLWKNTSGAERDYRNKTPFAIAQTAGTPDPLIRNAQGNTVIAYGAAALPEVIDALNPGTAMNFRAESTTLFGNFQRLCLQARTFASFGLEMFARLEGVNNSTPTFYLRRRTSRPAAYTPEEFIIPTSAGGGNVLEAKRGLEGLTAARAILVIGSGDGVERVAGLPAGTGNTEVVYADKSVENGTNAFNMANRVLDLLNPSTEIVTFSHARHTSLTVIGDDVVIKQAGLGDATLRCFYIEYNLSERRYIYTVGRPRPGEESASLDLEASLKSISTSTQHTNSCDVDIAQPTFVSNAALANNATITSTLNFVDCDFFFWRDEALTFYARVQSDASGPFDVEIIITNQLAGNQHIYRQRVNLVAVGGDFEFLIPIFIPVGLRTTLLFGAEDEIVSATLDVTNRSGANRDVTIDISGHVIT